MAILNSYLAKQMLQTKTKRFVKRFVSRVFCQLGYELTIQKIDRRASCSLTTAYTTSSHQTSKREGINLNIGCGSYHIDGFISLDLDTEHYHAETEKNFLEYDIRNDSIPFSSDSVDNIYISHVIEHIETHFVENLFREVYRVLKPTGVLRICCPDTEFLFQVSSFENDYWRWRDQWFTSDVAEKVDNTLYPTQLDYFIREVATPRSRYYKHRIKEAVIMPSIISNLSYDEIINMVSSSLEFRTEFPGDHINAWDFNRIHALGSKCGFSYILKSKQGASLSRAMQGSDMDRKHPQMTLYADLVK